MEKSAKVYFPFVDRLSTGFDVSEGLVLSPTDVAVVEAIDAVVVADSVDDLDRSRSASDTEAD